MRFRHVFQRTERDAIQAVRHIESTFAHVIQFQVRTYFVLVHVVFMLFRLLEVITPVPAFGLEIVAFALDFLLDVGKLFFRFRQRGCPKPVEQVVHVLFVLCHPVFQYHRSVIFVSHQFGFLQPGGNQVAHHLLVVGIVPVISPVDVSLVDAFAQGTVIGILQERHDTGIVQRKHPFAILTHALGGLGGLGNQAGGQAAQVFLISND